MVFLCYSCAAEFPNPDSLVFHLQLNHSMESVINNYKCMQHIGCTGLIFDSLLKFKNHLTRQHAADIGARNLAEPAHFDEPEGDPNLDDEIVFHDEVHVAENIEDNQIPNFEDFAKAVYNSGLTFTAKLYDKDTLPRCVVQDVVTYVDAYLGGFVKLLKNKVLNTLANNENVENVEAEVRDIEAMFQVLENPFAEIATEAQRISALKNAGAYIGSTRYFIGSSFKEIRVNGVMTPQMVPSFGQLVCMKRTLKSFLELPGVFEKIMLNYANLSDVDDVISNFIQGSLWKHMAEPYVAEGKIVLPIVMYSDDYETNNGLGSHALDEKTNGLYYKIPCIPEEYLSLLRYIFIAAVFHVNDRKEYGVSACVNCVVRQLQDLKDNGILVELPDRTVRVYFLLGLTLGDNLGLNTILGFVESFSANYCCRICKVYREDLRFMVRDNPALVRTRENYTADLAVNDVALTGVKEDCPFNVLEYFHAAVNVTGDVLHDVEEGLCGYALPRILHWLIHVRQYLTLETFLDRVRTFNYGPSECGNRPPASKLSKDRIIYRSKFLLSGSESLCLTQNLGLMIGDLIPAEEEVRSYYLCLLELIDFVMAPSFRRGAEVHFKNLVTDHHEMFIATFDEALKPIHHMLLHYYKYMLLIGPPIHTSTKRFESKNRESVQVARSTNSRVNLLLTIIIKNQLKFSYQLLSETALSDRFVSGTGKLLEVRDLPFGPLAGLDGDDRVTSFKWIDYKGTNYQIDHVVVVVYEINDLYPQFGRIVGILLHANNQIAFILSVLETVNYYQHYHSHVVRETNFFHVCHPLTLISFQTLWLRTSTMGELFVPFRYIVY